MSFSQSLDDDLLVNRILDKYYEAMRPSMPENYRARLDALTPDARREFAQRQLLKKGEQQ